MDEHLMKSLARRLSLTDLEDETEEYILTKEEEAAVIHHHEVRAKEHREWKLKEAGFSKEEIEAKIASTDWNITIDAQSILKKANSFKHQSLWHNQRRELEKKEDEDKAEKIKNEWTAKRMFGLMKWVSSTVYKKDLIVNDSTKYLITVVCYFLSRDKRFETDLGFDLNKGLLIRGISGLGKTYTVQCVSENPLNPVNVISALEIQEEVKATGNFKVIMGENKILYVDDVGTEEPAIFYYKTKVCYMKTFLELFYLNNKIYNTLILSTNNSFQEIEEKYGFRVRSRMKDMMNIVDVEGEDMRGNKTIPNDKR